VIIVGEGDRFYMTNWYKNRRRQGGPINRNDKMSIGYDGPEIFVPNSVGQIITTASYLPIGSPMIISVAPNYYQPRQDEQWQCEYCGQTNHYIDTSCQYCGGRKPFHKSRF